jgi:GT2 family glycosyltransferase
VASPGAPSQSPLDVLLVAYRSGPLLEQCLTIVADFAPPGTRVIVLDNSPDDPSAAEAVAHHPTAELRPQAGNVGFATAVNDGLRHSSAELVLLINPDIASIEGSFADVQALFASAPDVGAVAVHLTDEDGKLERCRRRPRRLDFYEFAIGIRRFLPARLAGPPSGLVEWDHLDTREVESATGALLFLRRAAIDDVGMLDEQFFMYWEETDWLMRAHARGWRLLFTPEIRGVHAGRQSSDVGRTAHSLLFLKSSYVYVGKHFGAGSSLLLRATSAVFDGGRLTFGLRRSADYRREAKERLLVHLGLSR